METYLIIICILLAVTTGFLIIKLLSMKKSLENLANDFSQMAGNDSNTMLRLDIADRQIKNLAQTINQTMEVIRQEQLKYQNGDKELKTAVTNISHDLRTPLTAISGYLELLQNEELTEEAKRYLGYIKNRTDALKKLTEELFRYSVILAEKSTSENGDRGEREEICLNRLLEENLAGLYPAFTEKGISPEVSISDVLQNRNFSASDVSRIYQNILSNALKYSEGDLLVTMDEHGLTRFTNSAQLDTVSTAKLFDRFYTVSDARKSTGLGLSIAKTLVNSLGGEISAEYENGKLSIVLRL